MRCWCPAMCATGTASPRPGASPFLKEAADRLPTFFSLGNHETRQKQFRLLVGDLERTGAEVLINRYVRFGECWIGGWYPPSIVREPT